LWNDGFFFFLPSFRECPPVSSRTLELRKSLSQPPFSFPFSPPSRGFDDGGRSEPPLFFLSIPLTATSSKPMEVRLSVSTKNFGLEKSVLLSPLSFSLFPF